MKGIWIWGLLLSVLLTGCAGVPAAAGASESRLSQASLQADPAPDLEREAATLRLLPEEEVLRAYEQAQEAWAWFSTNPLPYGRAAVEIGGHTYWKVAAPEIQDMEALENHLQWIFSEELTDQLLQREADTPPYQECEGSLYVCTDLCTALDHSRGAQQLQIERETETRFSVNVAVELLDDRGEEVVGLEFWSFPYELLEDRWVFTSFAGIN